MKAMMSKKLLEILQDMEGGQALRKALTETRVGGESRFMFKGVEYIISYKNKLTIE